MDGRDGMSSPGSSPYYTHRGGIHGSVSSGTAAVSPPGLHVQSGFMPVTNVNISEHSNGSVPTVEPSVEPAKKKKRGRPRKYVPDDPEMVLELTPLSSRSPADEPTITPKKRGRPAGSGRKQQLSLLGGWMNSSAGLAFAPHVIHVAHGEDAVSKIISFSQKKSRAVCILSATGSVSSVTLRQQSATSSSSNDVTFEGRFQIVCLSGSYLVAESGGRNRTGGLSVSLCRSDGNVIGGAVGGMLIADGPVQVVLSSFVYGGLKEKEKVEAVETPKQDQSLLSKSDDDSSPEMVTASRKSKRNPEMDIDLTCG